MGFLFVLFTIIYYWLLIVLFLAFTSAFLSVTRISIGIHPLYSKFLLFLFDWSREKLEGYGEDDEEEELTAEGFPFLDPAEYSNKLLNDLQNNDDFFHSKLSSSSSENLQGEKLRSSSGDSQTEKLRSSGDPQTEKLRFSADSQTEKLRNSSRSPQRRRIPSGNLQSKKLFKPEAKIDLYSRLNSVPAENELLKEILKDSSEWVKWGIERIIYDDVTESFASAELPSWNLLTRTDRGYAFISLRVTIVWVLGTLFRFLILLPVRSIIFCMSLLFLCITCPLFGYFVPEGPLLRWLDQWMNLVFYRILSRAISLDARFHHEENRAQAGGICVANHTSPIDVLGKSFIIPIKGGGICVANHTSPIDVLG